MNDGVLDTSAYVRVTNHTDRVIKAKYDGVEYTFGVGTPVDVHIHAAGHIFCFGKDDKTNAFHRLWWLDGRTYDAAKEILDKITFEEVPQPAVDISSKRRSKISKPTPLVNAGADDGEEDSSSPSDATGTLGDF